MRPHPILNHIYTDGRGLCRNCVVSEEFVKVFVHIAICHKCILSYGDHNV